MRTKATSSMVCTFAVIAALAVVAAVPAFAHHGSAAYDLQKTITSKATVTSLTWANPHCLLNFDTREPSGEIKHWHVEMYNPSYMTRAGWNRELLKSGDEITISFHPAKNGTGNGFIRAGDGKIVYNGKELGLSDDAPDAQ
jgi:hypothetical protein